MPLAVDRTHKIVYPPSCKELSEEQSKDELVRRLKLLARAFQEMGQDENNEYKQLALYLTGEFFLDHSNKDVRLLVACCIADIFRIFAPAAPYTEADQLKEIFLFLTQQLRGLEDPEAPSFKRYFYLLENLAWVKSFNICIELEDNQKIFCQLYKLIFSIVNEKHSSKVMNFMLDMMCPLIAEADSVSQELLDIIMINIVEPYKTQNKYAYNLAKDLLRRTANAVEPYIQTFFNNVLMIGKSSESEISDRLYELIYELNSIAPNVLLAVLPQLEFKLKSSDPGERKSVTRMLSRMFSDPGSDLAVQNKPLWNCYVGRFNDIDVDVRRACVQACQDLIVNHQELISDIQEPLKQRQHDPDENVRMDVVQAVIGAAKREFSNITPDLLDSVKERILDKKYKIRKEALMGLGVVYKKLMLKDSHTSDEGSTLSWIRNKILHAYYRASLDDRILVERLLNTALVPYSLEPQDRMRRLYVLYGNVDENAVKALHEILKTQRNVRNIVRNLLDLHRSVTDNKQLQMNRVLQLSKQLPDAAKAKEYMNKFNQILTEDIRIRNTMSKLVSPDCTCKKAEEYVREILKKMGNPIPQNFLHANVKLLLERVAPVMIDGQAVQSLLSLVAEAVEGLEEITGEMERASEVGLRLLLAISAVYPQCFNDAKAFQLLITFVKDDDDAVVDLTLQVLAQVGAKLEREHPEIHATLLPILQKLVKIGTPKQAKHAIRCIDKMCANKQKIFTQIFEHLNKNMDLDSPNFLTSLVGIGHMAQLCPGEFASPVKGIVTRFIVKDLLMQDRGHYQPTSESWCEDRLVSEETKAKVEALKMMVRWLLGIKNNLNNSVSSTLRLLYTMILHEGDLLETGKINKAEMARLRLQAGCCMLKLAQEPQYSELVTLDQFQMLALLLNDPCYQVRLMFAQKLHMGLISLRLPLQYLSIFSLAANDPEKERRLQCKNFLTLNISKRRDFLKQHSAAMTKVVAVLPEYVVPYTIHLLAHDPDLTSHTDTETLKNIRECLWFIMEPLIKSENYSFTFFKKMLETIKQTQDVQDSENADSNCKMYAVCDLALNLIYTKTGNFVLKDFPAEAVLPRKLFTDPDPNFPNTRVYLPDELMITANKGKKIGIMPGIQSSTVTASSDKTADSSRSHDVSQSLDSSQEQEPSLALETSSNPDTSQAESPAAQLSTSNTASRGRGRKPKSSGKTSEESDVARTPSPPSTSSRGRGRGTKNGEKKAPGSTTEPGKSRGRGKTPSRLSTSPRGAGVQGKITDFIKPSSSSNNNNTSSTRSVRRSASPEKSTNKRGSTASRSPSQSCSPQPTGKENAKTKSALSASQASSPSLTDSPEDEPPPAKQPKKRGRPAAVSKPTPPNKSQKTTAAAASPQQQESPRKRTRDPSPTPNSRSTSKRLRGGPPPPHHDDKIIPSPTESLSPTATSGRRANRPPAQRKSYPVRSNVRKAASLAINGTSDGEDGTPDSHKSPPTTPASLRKRAGAALTTAVKGAASSSDAGVKRRTRVVKKR